MKNLAIIQIFNRRLCVFFLALCHTLFSTAACSEKPLPEPEPDKGSGTKNIRQADFFPNPALWKVPLVDKSKGFYMHIQLNNQSVFMPGMLKSSILAYGMGHTDRLLPHIVYEADGTGVVGAAAEEWGWSITHLDGQKDGAGMTHDTRFTGANAPGTRKEAVEKIREYLNRQYIKGASHPWFSMNHHYPWHHYAGEMGFDFIGSEIGENVNNYQWHIALTRGAARQYGTPWVFDFSAWHGPSITDYSGVEQWTGYSSPDGGHSMNLLERSFLICFMSGCNYLIAEAGAQIAFYNEREGTLYKISPYGEVCRKINRFAVAHPEIAQQGDGYAPIGIVLDYYHGAYAGVDSKKSFFTFPYNDGDNMTWDLIDMIWPGGWLVQGRQELGAMVNGPYGDNFDVLLQNASQNVLNSYPALVLSGDVKLSSEEVSRYKAYVEQGGILMLNTAYLSSFPEFNGALGANSRYDKNFGKGKVIVYGANYKVNNLGMIFNEILAEKIPFNISKDIEYMLNIRDNCIYLTLINNDGVTKDFKTPPVVDASKSKSVTVAYKGKAAIQSVKDIYNNRNVTLNGLSATLTLPAGGMAVLEFYFADL
jgi:hypothetical protein